MKIIFKNLITFLILLGIILIPLSCATTTKKEPSPGLEEKTKTAETEVAGPSFITKLKPEMLEDASRIYIKATGPLQYTAFKLTDPLRLILDISGMQPKPEVQEPIQFNKGAINSISTHYFSENNITRVIIGLNQNVSHDISKLDDNGLIIDIGLPPEIQAIPEIKAPPSVEKMEEPYTDIAKNETLLKETEVEKIEVVGEDAESEKKKYTGKLISLDFQNADLTSILRLIAGVSELNIITSPDVKGTITLRLIEVPWDQALDLILKNNQLGMQREGNIIRITTAARLTAEKQAKIAAIEMEKQAKKSQETLEKIKSKTIQISYADLDNLTTILNGMKSARGDIQVDSRTSTMIIRDTQGNIDNMMDLIKTLDIRTQQVTIEARIVEVNTNYSRELGVQWGGTLTKTTNKNFPNTVRLGGGLPGGDLSGSSVTAPNFIVDLPAAVGSGTGAAVSMSLGSFTGSTLLDVRLSAMENSGMGKVLSSPKITTANHKQATIKSGRTFYIETVSSDGTQTTAIDADIKLTVTPHITPDGFIRLEIDAKKNEADFGQTSSSGTPTMITKEAQTEVLVKDGGTTVLGGLYKTTRSDSDSGVPWLSKVPVLKWLFKHQGKRTDTEELLIFITPKIDDNV